MSRFAVAFVLVAGLTPWSWAADWPQWRGPAFNGSTEETNLPAKWSTTEGVAWSVDLPGPAAATPIVCGDRVFISSSDASKDLLQALCFDRRTGKLLWKHDIAHGMRQDHRSNYASGSPATDGKLVVFFYGNGDLAAFDLEGKKLWSRNIQKDYGPFAFQWTFSASPVLYGGKLYIQVLQRDVPVRDRGMADKENESYILGLEPATGKTLWRVVRPSPAVAESREAFTTPMPYEHKGRRQLLVLGGDVITGHDLETGKELWRWGTWNPKKIGHWRLVPSPVAGDGIALACAPKRDPIYAVFTDRSGSQDDKAVAWTSAEQKDLTSDVPTPAFYQGDFFILSDLRRTLARVEPRTGKVKWAVATPGKSKYEASPLAADGKIYLMNHDGEVAVLRAADGEVLHTVAMDDPADGEVVQSSVSAAHGQLFIRTTRKLYCIGVK